MSLPKRSSFGLPPTPRLPPRPLLAPGSGGAGGRQEPLWVRFATGGVASCVAEAATLPIDITKVRLQVGTRTAPIPPLAPPPTTMLSTLRSILTQEGTRALYKGLSPALLRQASYSSLRMGMYEPILAAIAPAPAAAAAARAGTAKDVGFAKRAFAGGTAGAVSIVIANPTELLKVRMQADSAGTRYPRGVWHALTSTARAEGLRGLWRGAAPNAQRAYIVNAAELASYDQAKVALIGAGLGAAAPTTHVLASMGAGAVAAVCSHPVDLVKNRLMTQQQQQGLGREAGPRQYRGMLHCAASVVREEGFRALYRGLVPNACRIGLFCVVMFTAYEQLRAAASRLAPQEKKAGDDTH